MRHFISLFSEEACHVTVTALTLNHTKRVKRRNTREAAVDPDLEHPGRRDQGQGQDPKTEGERGAGLETVVETGAEAGIEGVEVGIGGVEAKVETEEAKEVEVEKGKEVEVEVETGEGVEVEATERDLNLHLQTSQRTIKIFLTQSLPRLQV